MQVDSPQSSIQLPRSVNFLTFFERSSDWTTNSTEGAFTLSFIVYRSCISTQVSGRFLVPLFLQSQTKNHREAFMVEH